MDGVKIGVGIITMGVRELDPGYFTCRMLQPENLFIYTDSERKGVSHARNQCLKHFEGFDHVFLFDDDCRPMRSGWEEYLISNAEKNNVHYMCIPNIFYDQIIGQNGEMLVWTGGLGPFQYFTKHGLETLGGYNLAYTRYGFEDAGMKHRALKAGLTGHPNGWSFPLRALVHIFSEDVTHQNPKPNMSQEEKEAFIQLNRNEYFKEINSEQIYYALE
ncbi:glycosyltransferase family A protein [Enterobacter huaxiensis]|uniref:glycosyltransferase family A protein n=1 Tax=Enterobacter huaxiensis TaxID=2494702 RepID=UPI002175D2E5|nr:glycosyltransferase family A protein [Enterobacter huaxiensis]MCS5452510.1 glycosyltransferase family 2 protein [Enterobacter huaxiensis]